MHATPTARPLPAGLLLGTALLVTLFLFYIDEGRYTLSGLERPGNLVAMSLYFIGLTLGLFAVNALLARRAPGVGRTAVVLIAGCVSGVALTIGLIYVLHGGQLPG